ncbi:conserved hypothetical protein [Altererythrobacter sp. B11]|uniref:hypothetical protein n=1 Tax=Altererythrobacter sp. B11 TaxID=2060312 RepID=UPI000DC6DD68|nr:hypothetical protein [Altererythrobacter sp. B11]BBC74403.1 conserved hypothetical protein [Altererythrobacter sp. B11]
MAEAALNTNVVRLPTAARRKVQQPCNAAARAARKAFREACPWPGEYLFPNERAAMKTAEVMRDMTATPELELLTAICSVLSEEQRAKVSESLAVRAIGRGTAQQALAVFRTTSMTVGERIDLSNAMRRLGGN